MWTHMPSSSCARKRSQLHKILMTFSELWMKPATLCSHAIALLRQHTHIWHQWATESSGAFRAAGSCRNLRRTKLWQPSIIIILIQSKSHSTDAENPPIAFSWVNCVLNQRPSCWTRLAAKHEAKPCHNLSRCDDWWWTTKKMDGDIFCDPSDAATTVSRGQETCEVVVDGHTHTPLRLYPLGMEKSLARVLWGG